MIRVWITSQPATEPLNTAATKNRLVQLNYRYASPEYIQATLPSYSTAQQYKEGISQVGMTASWPIVDRWSVVGAYYFDTNTKKSG